MNEAEIGTRIAKTNYSKRLLAIEYCVLVPGPPTGKESSEERSPGFPFL